ncbi:MAG: DUF378 domain-containing protein [Candidatus Paceibacterota bacterium]
MCKDCCKKGGCTMAMIAKVLVVIGGINWGLVGLGMLLGVVGGWNVVNMIVGSIPTLEAVIYILVGISAVMLAFGCKCGKCVDGVCASCEAEAPKMEGSM